MRMGIDVTFTATELGVTVASKGLPPTPIADAGFKWAMSQVRQPFDEYVASLEEEQWANARRAVDAAHSMADRVVWDSLASAVLRRAVAAPAEERDRLLAQLGVEGRTRDGKTLTGMEALHEAGVLDADGCFVLPKPGTAEYVRYVDWAKSEAKGFSSRINLLAGPAGQQFTKCVARHVSSA